MNQIILGYAVVANNSKITVAYDNLGFFPAHVNFHCESALHPLHSWPWAEETVPIWDTPTSWQMEMMNG